MLCQKHAYPMNTRKIKKSPLKTRGNTIKAMRNFKRGKAIGFTRRSSLKSMGLLPRSSGCYELGAKYSS